MTGIGERLDAEWDAFTSHLPHHHHQPVPVIPTTQENTVTTPQRTAESLHAITGEIASNPLVASLIDSRQGKALTDREIAAVTALVAAIEYEQQRNAAIVTQIWGRVQQSDEALSAAWLRSLITGQAAPQQHDATQQQAG